MSERNIYPCLGILCRLSAGSGGSEEANCHGEPVQGAEEAKGEARDGAAVGVRVLFLLVRREFRDDSTF
jgi:hypothetical protein